MVPILVFLRPGCFAAGASSPSGPPPGSAACARAPRCHRLYSVPTANSKNKYPWLSANQTLTMAASLETINCSRLRPNQLL